ncbi:MULTISPECIES: YqcC family protein [Pantoea]|uniref:YqcC family protein n=1 Tax=Pantoea TaxID=53335 RepID=UPI001F2233DE|nr:MULTISPECIES: YqcC family protein [Pantoea]UIL53248.1 YqcC family protein [Pantoea agglomerans]
MTPEQLIMQRLEQVEAVLREHDLWQSTPPEASAFDSREPFCLDTLEPLQWLQWVLIPRMHALIAARHPLPKNFAVAPYYEVALVPDQPGVAPLLLTLRQLDALLKDAAV